MQPEKSHQLSFAVDRRLRNPCQAILIADRGRRHSQIAEDLHVTPRTPQRWLHAYRPGGLDKLTMQGAAGRLTTRFMERSRKPKPTRSKQRYMQDAFARHLRDVAQAWLTKRRGTGEPRSRPYGRPSRIWSCPHCPVTVPSCKGSGGSGRACDAVPPTIACFRPWLNSSGRCATACVTTQRSSIASSP